MDTKSETKSDPLDSCEMLPEKSLHKYKNAYDIFIKWQQSKGINSFAEPDLLAYFDESSKIYKPSTMWSMYSMLKSTIICHHNINISDYSKLLAFLKEKSVGFTSKKYEVFTTEEINKFLVEAPDNRYLAMKTVVVFGVIGALKVGRVTDFMTDYVTDQGDEMIVRIPNTKTIIAIDGQYAEIVRKYMKLRPVQSTTNRFFLQFKNGKCTTHHIGKNKIAGMPKEMAEFLALPKHESYTLQSFCRTTTKTANSGAEIEMLIRHGQCKSGTVAGGYITSRRGAINLESATNAIVEAYEHYENAPKKMATATSNVIIAPQHYENGVSYELSSAVQEGTTFCRACSTEIGEGCQKIYLFEENSSISEIFTKCTGLEIYEFDNLPAYICEECNSNIIIFHRFRLICENSDLYFRENLLCTSVEIKNEIFEVEEVKLESFDLIETEASYAPEVESSEQKYHDSTLECDLCGKFFYQKHLLEVHLRRHCGLKPYQCNLCNKGFENKNQLRSHRSKHRTAEDLPLNFLYKCTQCNKKFQKEESLQGHLRQHQGLAPFECKLCDTTFTKLKYFKCHNDHKHNEDFQKMQCNYSGCDKAFTSRLGLKLHISYIHLGIEKSKIEKKYNYVCEVCGKSYNSKAKLKIHSYRHTGERPFNCTLCSKTFTTERSLKIHILRHKNIKNFECSYCGIRKVTLNDLRVHMNDHMPDQVFPCPQSQCPATFSRESYAKRHFKNVHCGYKPFKCNGCSRSFTSSSTLKNHEMIHSGEKMSAHQLRASSLRACSLPIYLVFDLHTNIQPHACNLCDKRFIRLDNFKMHLKVHDKPADKRPFKCNTCSQSFCKETALKRHEMTHTGEKPHACNICGKTFRQTHVLKHHQMTHSGEKPHACNICDKRFIQVIALKKHLEKHMSSQ